ncbi:MAG: hypothetical protein JW705_04470 [Methanosarcinaceae archaeon]|nr:hypothetical protein [Methanosarcinaceae archaeon]
MNSKIFVIFLLLCSLIAAGCVTEEGPDADGAVADEDQNQTSEADNASTGTDNGTTSGDGETTGEETTEEDGGDNESGVTVIEPTGPRTYTVTLKNFLAQPATHTINEGDSIFWINMNQPNRVFVLVSDEGLWENKSLTYRSSYLYSFNESGTYSYHILGFEERMKGTITVK